MAQDLLNSGASWLAGKRRSDMATQVTYIRASDSFEVTLRATRGRSEHTELDEGGTIAIRAQSVDFIFNAEDLVDGDDLRFEPSEMDLIVIDDGVHVLTYEVHKPQFEAAWRYTDSHRKSIRVHTKLLDEEDSP